MVQKPLYAVVVFIAVATTLIAPPLLTIAFRGLRRLGAAASKDDDEQCDAPQRNRSSPSYDNASRKAPPKTAIPAVHQAM